VFPDLLDNLPHLPTQLYESAFTLLLVPGLLWSLKRKKFDGQVFWTYVGSYSVFRFCLEFLRGDAQRGTLISNVLSPAQWISLAGLALALWFLAKLKK
jgi:phosphatidylglycerol---prolipoprotein diacylglyceryl transferase